MSRKTKRAIFTDTTMDDYGSEIVNQLEKLGESVTNADVGSEPLCSSSNEVAGGNQGEPDFGMNAPDRTRTLWPVGSDDEERKLKSLEAPTL
jgi:hypothetical protein